MPFRSRYYVREIASAAAVLAIYLLVLLAPLHQAAGLQRDLNALGYTSLETASICASLAKNELGQQVAKCTAAGIGKNEILQDAPPEIVLFGQRVISVVGDLPEAVFLRPTRSEYPGRPRAPPVTF